jgi:hypothetical protein
MEKLLKNKFILTPIILFILGFAPFLLNLRGFFVSDDWDFLMQVANPHQPLWRYFLTNYLGGTHGESYRPLIVYFWAAAHHFFGLNYFWYHFLQISLHAGCVVLLYFVILNFWHPVNKSERFILATAAAIIFAILPNHSEAVAWIAAVVDPLCAFFYLASLLALLLCLKFSRAKIYLYVASLIFFLAAIFTKEMAMSLPFIVLIFAAYYFVKKHQSRKILFTVPYFILLAGYFWLRYRAIGLFFGYYGDEHLHLSLGKIAASYGDIILSFVLSDKLRTVVSLWLNNNLLIIFIIFILFLLALKYLNELKKLPAWPWLIFLAMLVSLVPVMNFGVNLTGIYFSEEGERYGYLPSIFFAILIAAALLSLRASRESPPLLPKEGFGGGLPDGLRRSVCNCKKIIFSSIIILIAAGLLGQLLIKNQRQYEAAALAQNSLQSAVAKMQEGNYRGVLFFGLPDDYHGANIFRNGWQEAIKFYLPNPPIMLAPFSRTAYSADSKFTVEKISASDYNYASTDGEKLILAKPQFSSPDYSTALKNYIYEARGSSNRYFGDKLTITLSPDLAAQNNVALFFWNGNDWTILTTN